MADSIEISIIIVNYNSFKLLQACLESIFKHFTGFDFEIIVIDNNSSEGNVDDIVSNFNDIILIKNKVNKGFGAANNQGLKIAKGKYILFLNNDTVFLENSIKKIYDYAETLNGNSIISCKLLNEDKSLQHSVYDFPTLLNVFTSNFFLYLLFPKSKLFNKYHLMNRKINETTEVDVVTGAFLLGTKRKIQEIGGFDERFFFYNEETDLCYRFKKSGGKTYYFPNTSIIHLKGGTANKNGWFAYRNQSISTIKFFQKHFYGLKYLSAVLIHYIGIFIRIPIFLLIGLITLNKDLLVRSLFYLRLLFIFPKNLFNNNTNSIH